MAIPDIIATTRPASAKRPDDANEFLFVLQPLKIDGATGSTVAPTAIR